MLGGTETFHYNLAEALTAAGHEVVFFSMYDERNIPCAQDKYFVSNVNYNDPDLSVFKKVKMGIKLIYSFESKHNIEKLIQDEKPDIAHIGLLHRQITFSVVDVLKKYNIPIVMHMFTTYRLIEKANKVVYGNKVCYYYVHRPNSILTGSFSDKHLDVFEALHIMMDSGILKSKEANKAYKSQMVSSMAELIEKKPPINEKVQELWEETKKYRFEVLCDSKASKRVRAQACLMLLGYKFTEKIIVAYYKNKWR